MFTFLHKFITRSLVVLLVSMLSVNYLPEKLFSDFPFEPKSKEPNNYDLFIGQWNTKLSDGQPEYIQLNQIIGPESIAEAKDSGLLYTGLADGRIVELDPSKNYKVRQLLKFKQSTRCPDDLVTRADECGRFLQVRFLNNTLYAVEANTGLYKIDTKSGAITFVGPKSLNRINIYNSFAFDQKEPNIAYLTISSTRRNLLNIIWSFMELETSGQLLALDINTGKRVIVLDNLSMANGIDVDGKRDQLLFSETMISRVNSLRLSDVRAAFKKAKDGEKLSGITVTPLIPIVPGNPDNIIIEGDIAYIALPFVKVNGNDLMDQLSTMPSIRKFLARLIFGTGRLLQYIDENLYHNPLLETVYLELKCGHVIYRAMQTDKAAVLEYNLANGSSRFLGSDKFGFTSEATPDSKGNLLIGSFRLPFIVKVKV